jgi:hypothetical protein
MPMSKDPSGGGTNHDGTRSDEYCSLCYGDGVFYYQDGDGKDFQRYVYERLQEKGWWRILAWLGTREIPRLKRWR